MHIFWATQVPQVTSEEILILFPLFMVTFLFSLSFHEAAHAFMAHKCGDDTARLLGRMTLNPIVHIDPIGTLLLPGIAFLSSLAGGGVFMIGWAKPVPVNPLNFNNYRKGEILVSLACTFSNLMLIAVGSLICRALVMYYLSEETLIRILDSESQVEMFRANPFFTFFFIFAFLNSILFIFNLIPIPPLDGSHVLEQFLSGQAAEAYNRVMRPYGLIILIALLWLGVFSILFSIMSYVVLCTIFVGIL